MGFAKNVIYHVVNVYQIHIVYNVSKGIIN